MGVISMIGSLLEALGESSSVTQKNTRPVPADRLSALLKEGRKKEAVTLLRTSMGWSAEKSVKFIDSVKNTEYRTVGNATGLKNKTSTQIDTLLKDHRHQESNGGGSLLEYFLAKFKK